MLMFYLIMPLQGTSRSFGMEIFVYVVLPTLFVLLLGLLLSIFPFSQTKGQRLSNIRAFCLHQAPVFIPIRVLAPVLLVWLIVLYHFGDAFLDISGFLQSRLNGSTFIEDNYVSPASVSLTFPEKKRNLITLYIESCESTSQDIENGGVFPVNYIQGLTRLAKENVSFSQNNQITGAAVAPACGWTMAGLIAQSAGIPLKYYDINSDTIDQMGSDFIQFMPGVISLGDLLQGNGYHNVFMAGSDFTFGGRTQYYSQHGNYEILDLVRAKELRIQGAADAEGWGMLDKDLYAWAKEELLKLADERTPFHLAILTLDTHYPVHTCDRCPDVFPSAEEKAIACSSEQAAEFVRWCQEQTFYENTTIVITGDHASMIEGFYDAAAGKTYDKYNGEQKRLVYNAFIHPAVSPVQEKNRQFTTIDFFPTVLASIGVQIGGEQLALGVNLFSDRQTLSEKYGYDAFFSGLNHKSVFYDMNLLYP